MAEGTSSFKFGESYLIRGNSFECAYTIFAKLVSDEKKGMLVWRTHPKKDFNDVKRKYMQTIWISNITSDTEHLHPHELEQLSYNIEKFMKQNKGSVVLLLSVEYLISFNSFTEILHLIQTLRDLAAENNILFLVYIGKDTLEKQQENLLKQELMTVGEANGKD